MATIILEESVACMCRADSKLGYSRMLVMCPIFLVKTLFLVISEAVKLKSFCWSHMFFVFQVHNYVGEWLQYQSLWDLQPDNLYGKLGEDINLWMKCLNDIK
jgi:hypothetical protein